MTEDSGITGCDAMCLGSYFQRFWTIIVPSASGSSKKNSDRTAWTWRWSYCDPSKFIRSLNNTVSHSKGPETCIFAMPLWESYISQWSDIWEYTETAEVCNHTFNLAVSVLFFQLKFSSFYLGTSAYIWFRVCACVLTHWHTQPAVRRAEPSMPLRLILCQ
jgi:hypothetical protein